MTHRDLILEQLRLIYNSDADLDLFMSTPNRFFHYRAPADCLNQGDYSVFYDLLDREQSKTAYL